MNEKGDSEMSYSPGESQSPNEMSDREMRFVTASKKSFPLYENLDLGGFENLKGLNAKRVSVPKVCSFYFFKSFKMERMTRMESASPD